MSTLTGWELLSDTTDGWKYMMVHMQVLVQQMEKNYLDLGESVSGTVSKVIIMQMLILDKLLMGLFLEILMN